MTICKLCSKEDGKEVIDVFTGKDIMMCDACQVITGTNLINPIMGALRDIPGVDGMPADNLADAMESYIQEKKSK